IVRSSASFRLSCPVIMLSHSGVFASSKSASHTLAPEFSALIVILRSVGPVISTRRSTSPGAGAATRQSGSSRTAAVSERKSSIAPRDSSIWRRWRARSSSDRRGPSSACRAAMSSMACGVRISSYRSPYGPVICTCSVSGMCCASPGPVKLVPHILGSPARPGPVRLASTGCGRTGALLRYPGLGPLVTAGVLNDSFGSLIDEYHLAPVSGVGDQAYTGNGFILVRKGHTTFVIDYQSAGGANRVPAGKREQALKQMASDVLKRLPAA